MDLDMDMCMILYIYADGDAEMALFDISFIFRYAKPNPATWLPRHLPLLPSSYFLVPLSLTRGSVSTAWGI
ncbi:predicted protein [Plenodomus lingam JN3]|uniref:Predicted protein n=1 Tax=Leptosphaeria maculans (strain JN3 / isolate v23.1.3 / race Av1-4-5-6-7-8) TaxID=985895 RepID=E4ZND7_LEPMJ|nr:predicted protein [Plenodomus lingam JN3]CBX92996.1 predicted protein [Plenodomus lingam JN3]